MITVRELHKVFGSNTVLDGLNLEVPRGESVVILGRSGSGKSILLKQIIGLIRPDAGAIEIDGTDIVGLDYDDLSRLRHRMAMLFQQAALFDSMTVGQNIGLALQERGRMDEATIAAKVAEALEVVKLPGIEDMRPASLSGGMRKRVGLARAIAVDPEYMLYDEPTAGLDPVTAVQINEMIRHLQERYRMTSIVVTHDLHSAFAVGDRICMLHEGRIRVAGTPDAFRRSDDPIVRGFLEPGTAATASVTTSTTTPSTT